MEAPPNEIYNTLIKRIDDLENKIKYLEENKNNTQTIKFNQEKILKNFRKIKTII